MEPSTLVKLATLRNRKHFNTSGTKTADSDKNFLTK